jgi:hypothetical protein
MLLVYSSFIFGIVSFVGLINYHWTGPAFYLQMVLSIVNHASVNRDYVGKKTINRLDKFLAHSITFITIYEAIRLPISLPLYVYWGCLSWVISIYQLTNLSNHPIYGDYWHGTVHLMSSIGTIALIYS